MMIEAFGYKRGDENLLKLRETSIKCTIDELSKIIDFFQDVKIQHEKVMDKTETCHSHFRDWDKEWSEEASDIIIVTVR